MSLPPGLRRHAVDLRRPRAAQRRRDLGRDRAQRDRVRRRATRRPPARSARAAPRRRGTRPTTARSPRARREHLLQVGRQLGDAVADERRQRRRHLGAEHEVERAAHLGRVRRARPRPSRSRRPPAPRGPPDRRAAVARDRLQPVLLEHGDPPRPLRPAASRGVASTPSASSRSSAKRAIGPTTPISRIPGPGRQRLVLGERDGVAARLEPEHADEVARVADRAAEVGAEAERRHPRRERRRLAARRAARRPRRGRAGSRSRRTAR